MGKSDLLFTLHPVILAFARLFSLFVLSPFFSGKSMPMSIRVAAAFGCSLCLAPPILESHTSSNHLLLHIFQELLVGYFIGFLFSLIFEAVAFAGQMVGTLMGLSLTELFDPLSSSYHPLLSRLFSLFLFILFFALDLHHPLLKLLWASFETIPLGWTQNLILGLIEMTTLMFSHALEFALYPLSVLLLLIATFAAISRFFPIFWIGFPLQLVIGLIALALGLHLFPPLLRHSFYQTLEWIKNAL